MDLAVKQFVKLLNMQVVKLILMMMGIIQIAVTSNEQAEKKPRSVSLQSLLNQKLAAFIQEKL